MGENDGEKTYGWSEVAKHSSKDDLWVVINGRIYDVTDWQHDHPGGGRVLLKNGGKDVSKLFRDVGHSPDAIDMRPTFFIGRVEKQSKL